MYSAKIQNSSGNVLLLTGDEAVYQVLNIDGLNPPQAQINTTVIVGLDGAKYNSAKLETRNIVLTVKINGDAEANRLRLYNYFRTKEWCTFYYSNGTLDVSIEGYVESVACSCFTNKEQAQISILCPSPYFKSVTEMVTDISSTLALFTFPFSINIGEPIPISSYNSEPSANVVNGSESESGCIIELFFSGGVSSVEIKNTRTGDDLILNHSFVAGDRVIINTNKGKKSVSLVRNGITSNLFSAVQKGSVFFQLSVGNNFFGFLADNGTSNDNVKISFSYYYLYRGV